MCRAMTMNNTYRSDIDGLRAIAVLAVLFYHFGIWPFTGGFVGVDIFFAISGYLITKIILAEAQTGTFSFTNFYNRRTRRLLPALLVTIACAYGAGFFFFSAEDFALLSGSTISAVLALSNVFFWSQSDYFDADAILKPLLHTWSLAVELQFYLVWPALILFLSKLGRRFVVGGILFSALVSFVAEIYMMQQDPSGAFYLTPFRIYEFALGAFAVCLEDWKPKGLLNAAYIGGFTALAFSIFTFSDSTIFPGYVALVPSAGAALMIYSGSSAQASWALRTIPMQFIGRISYSLYLVHWPLLVVIRYIVPRDLSALETCALLVGTFALAVLLHRYVETAFRFSKRPRLAMPVIFNLTCAVAALLIAAPATGSWLGRGWVWRMPATVQQINNFDVQAMRLYVWTNHRKARTKKVFATEDKHVVIIGDSQSGDFINMLSEAGQNTRSEMVTSVIRTECGVPFISAEDEEKFWNSENSMTVKSPHLIPICKQQMGDALNSPLLQDADIVIVSMLWRAEALKHLSAAVAELKKHTRADVYIVGRKNLKESSIALVNKYGRLEGIEIYASNFQNPDTLQVNNYLKNEFGKNYIDLMNIICPKPGMCHVLTEDLKPIFYDRGHLTKEGAAFLGRRLVEREASLF
jgi:peptidoglycan/LPS O-acetylase OafA/YrhL